MLLLHGEITLMNVLTRSISVSLLWAASLTAQTYDPTPIPNEIIGSPDTTTPLYLGDDNAVQLDLGFEFPFWDQTFTSAWVSSNGTISFSTSSNLCCNGQPLENAPRNTIYGFWTDLVSYSGNPYYRRSDGSFLVGWYATNEYGSNYQETIEVSLFKNGDIQFNYGNLGLQWHTATAGITGPNAGDNIQLFYGSDVSNLANKSGILRYISPTQPVDCNVTPMDPSCPPEVISPVQTVSTATVQQVEEAAIEQITSSFDEPTPVQEPVQEIVVAIEPEAESITEQVEEAIVAELSEQKTVSVEVAAERLSPDQVAALAATSEMAQQTIEMTSFSPIGGSTAQFGGSGSLSAGFTSQASTGGFSGVTGVEIGSSSSSPSSAATTLEILNMSVAAGSTQQPDQSGGSAMGDDNQSETMSAMASVPGFSAYTQVALQDRSDFYAVRDIYRNRRLRDANFELYRMMQTNDARWREMVDEQY